jgi:hypothetical protein
MSATASDARANRAPIFEVAASPRAGRLLSLAGASWPLTVGTLCFAVTAFISRYLFWDSYLDLAGGRYVARHGIPHVEALTTAGRQSWIDQQWLAHWAYYEAWSLGGYPLVAAMSSLLVASGFGLLCALMVSRGVPAQRGLVWTLVAFIVCFGNTVIRAQSFAYPLFVLVLWAILADARRPRTRFLLVIPLLVLWSNLHGTVLLGIALVVGYCGVRVVVALGRGRPAGGVIYAAVAAAALATTFANPYGTSIVDYYRALIGNPVVSHYIIEWAPPSLGSIASYGFFALLFAVLVIVGYGIGRGARPDKALLVLTAFLALAATQGVRYQAWFALAGSMLAAETLAAARPAPPRLAARVQRVGAAGIAVFALAALLVLARTGDSTFERLVPRGAMAATGGYVHAHPDARVLADDQTSSALLWLYPQTLHHVGFDARLEQYPHDRLRRWFTFLNAGAPGWPELIRRYDVIVVARRAHPTLAASLQRLGGWRTIFEDDDGIVVSRGGR